MSAKRHNSSGSDRPENYCGRSRGTDSKCNPQAEKIFLAACVCDSSVYFDFSQYISDGDFTVREYAQTYFVLDQFYVNSGDSLSLTKFEAKANDVGFSSLVGDSTIGELFQIQVSRDEAESAFAQIKKETVRRLYEDALLKAESYVDQTTDGARHIISTVEDEIIKVSDSLRYGDYSIKHLSKEAFGIIEKIADSPGIHGIDIGFPIWQKDVGQISNGTVHLIIADTKTGKSQLGLRSAVLAASKYKIPVLYCDSEMNQKQQSIRAMGMFLKIPYWIMDTGYWKLDDDELIERGVPENSSELFSIQQARMKMNDDANIKIFSEIPLYYLSINGLSVDDAMPFMRQWIMRYTKIDSKSIDPQAFIVYDYMKLAHSRELKLGIQEWQILGFSAGKLHDFMQKYNLPCLTFGQVNRNIDRSLNCIAGAKRLAELVDSVSIFAKKTPEEMALDSDGATRLMTIEAVRNGRETGGGYISYKFDGDIGLLEELDYIDANNRVGYVEG